MKRWQGGTMILRWCGAAMKEATAGFRRIKGWKNGMPLLVTALRENDRILDGAVDRVAKAG